MPYSFNPFSGNFDNTPSTLKGDTAYTNLQLNSATWVDAYETGTVFKTNSASYATIDFANSKFFPLSGGIITGNTRVNGNVTIFGDLTSTGTQTFANTVFATTSSLSVVHIGVGPAIWVGNNGTGDIASFYDLYQGVEVLHIGGSDGDYPNVGVKTSSPNKDFTVNGEISAKNTIWDSNGNSDQWNSVYSTVQTNSSTNWNYQGTDLKDLSANWQDSYAFVNSMSSSYATTNFVHSNFYSLTGGTINGSISATGNVYFNNLLISQESASDSILYVGDNKVGINTELPNKSLTVAGEISATGVISTSQDVYINNEYKAIGTVTTNTATTSSVGKIVVCSSLPALPDPETLYIVI